MKAKQYLVLIEDNGQMSWLIRDPDYAECRRAARDWLTQSDETERQYFIVPCVDFGSNE